MQPLVKSDKCQQQAGNATVSPNIARKYYTDVHSIWLLDPMRVAFHGIRSILMMHSITYYNSQNSWVKLYFALKAFQQGWDKPCLYYHQNWWMIYSQFPLLPGRWIRNSIPFSVYMAFIICIFPGRINSGSTNHIVDVGA